MEGMLEIQAQAIKTCLLEIKQNVPKYHYDKISPIVNSAVHLLSIIRGQTEVNKAVYEYFKRQLGRSAEICPLKWLRVTGKSKEDFLAFIEVVEGAATKHGSLTCTLFIRSLKFISVWAHQLYRQNLSSYVYKQGDDDNQLCCICLEQFKENEEIDITSCGHYFNTECIETWLENKKTCPVCRSDLLNADSQSSL